MHGKKVRIWQESDKISILQNLAGFPTRKKSWGSNREVLDSQEKEDVDFIYSVVNPPPRFPWNSTNLIGR